MAGKAKSKPKSSSRPPWTRARKTLALSVALFIMMAMVAVFSDEGILTVFEHEKELAVLRESNERLAQKNVVLKSEITALKKDPFAVESIARQKLNLVKPGEVVYQIVRNAPPSKSPRSPQ